MNRNIVIGTREDWGTTVPLELSQRDRRHPIHIIGKSGGGKSTLMTNIVLQDIHAGRGVGFFDPHGDECLRILNRIPPERVNDVIYFDPSDREFPIGLNPFLNVPPDKRDLVKSGFIGTIKSIWPDFFGPRMEDAFNAAVSAVLECQGVGLLSVLRMLSDDEHRSWILKQVRDPMVRSYWENFDRKDAKTRAEIVAPIENKLNQFLLSPTLRNILGQVRNRVDARQVMDRGQIFIANLSKGKIGADNANLLGSLLVTQFQIAAMSRADVPEEERQDFHLCIDEFHSFITKSFCSILAEARKYRLCLILAHQYFDQIDPTILSALMGNVGALITFRVGQADAEIVERAFGRHYAAQQFTALNNGEICARLIQNGKDFGPHFGKTFPPMSDWHGRAERILRNSRANFSAPQARVELGINKWMEKGLSDLPPYRRKGKRG